LDDTDTLYRFTCLLTYLLGIHNYAEIQHMLKYFKNTDIHYVSSSLEFVRYTNFVIIIIIITSPMFLAITHESMVGFS